MAIYGKHPKSGLCATCQIKLKESEFMRKSHTGRIKFLTGLFIAPLFVLSACAGNDEAGNDTSNTVVLAAQGEVPPVDPHRLTGTIGLRISDAIYDTLVRENLTETGDALSDIEPALAEEWTVSDDGMVFEFSIREEISFHDQTPLTAESVKLNFDRFT